MDKAFDINKFISILQEDLIIVFNRSSENGIHPVQAGRTKEIKIIEQLKKILPNGVGIGSGFVIDSYGNISNQCDLVIYEENIMPIFVEDSNSDYAFYPCEGVIAVGEIKSTLTSNEFNKCLDKLSKVKKMKRYCYNNHIFRTYLQTLCGESDEDDKIFDPENKIFDNIFTFIFCKNNQLSESFLTTHLKDYYKNKMEIGIDRIYSLDKKPVTKFYLEKDGYYLFKNTKSNAYGVLNANDISLKLLITDLWTFIQSGRTMPFDFKKYFDIEDCNMIEISETKKQEKTYTVPIDYYKK